MAPKEKVQEVPGDPAFHMIVRKIAQNLSQPVEGGAIHGPELDAVVSAWIERGYSALNASVVATDGTSFTVAIFLTKNA